MTTIKEGAAQYKSVVVNNIVDLDSVSVDFELRDHSFMDNDGKEVKKKVIEVNGETYYVPYSVLAQLRIILEEKPDLTKFKVKKTGEGLNTRYTVISL